ncbi:P-protein [Candidatus Kinetoplastibacterium sorsogonicusi]|uniref:Bifunctional chorismate mutase/prephenate dehydratase n=1 Tax=Candidatus Kinetoplastidibacterium kentomonadis TaxID=1576550 RepID=A0A3Q8ERN9_9PROT|nr:prephenate dehydratase [Candidatus Kinetoplastibacterium sorsogonicusi]AWD32529.1 P-protein [Candidatus Kinetoplastibacterium sorsogonicusi]
MDNLLILEKLKPFRKQIDDLDKSIVKLLNQRANIVKKIGKIKHEFHSKDPIIRPDREAAIISKLQEENTGDFPNEAISSVWCEIMSACRNLEKNITISYLGPNGSFSEQAVFALFGHSIDQLPCDSFDDVFKSVELKKADIGVVPIENSTEGAVNRTLDLLLNTSLKIINEKTLPIKHCLMSTATSTQNIKIIYAHPQASSQCIQWLNKNFPNIELVAASSNSDAARMSLYNKNAAAIAGEIAAKVYNLNILKSGIQDDINNRTRFISVGNIKTSPSKSDKTSLILSVPNKPGAVYEMLFPLVNHSVSMTRLESRPARNGKWDYFFYVDIEGHCDSPNISIALKELENNVEFFKLLGSYPTN